MFADENARKSSRGNKNQQMTGWRIAADCCRWRGVEIVGAQIYGN